MKGISMKNTHACHFSDFQTGSEDAFGSYILPHEYFHNGKKWDGHKQNKISAGQFMFPKSGIQSEEEKRSFDSPI